MSDIRVLFAGAEGRMGQALVPALERTRGLALVAAIDVDADLGEAVGRHAAEVVVDFTSPAAALPNARAILQAGAQGVIGTTGFSPADLDLLDQEAQAAGRGLLIAPNFSLGMLLMQRFAEQATRHFPRVEIVETHHEGKLDAPSGTALHTAERIAAAGAQAGAAPAEGASARGQTVGGVRIHSMRLPGIQARQEVHLESEGEGLVLRHDAHSRLCYLPGIVAAIRAIPGHIGLIRGLDQILPA